MAEVPTLRLAGLNHGFSAALSYGAILAGIGVVVAFSGWRDQGPDLRVSSKRADDRTGRRDAVARRLKGI